MNIAIISFDQELVTDLAKKMPDYTVKGYTDSLSLLREISFFDPDVIIYDATGGEIAFNALEFFIGREQIKGKKIKVLFSKENPVDNSIIEKFSDLDFYDKDTEIEKLINDIKSVLGKGEEKVKSETSAIESFEEEYQPPQDMEALLADSSTPEEEIDLTIDTGELEDVNEILKEFETVSEEKKEEKESKTSSSSENVVKKSVSQPEFSSSGSIKLTIELSPEEIRKTVLEIAVEKLIEEIKNDLDIQRIKEDLQKDFFDRLDKELKNSAEEIKENIKKKIFESIESDLKEKVKESIKEDVTRITTELVKEKLNQVFGNK